MKILSPTLNRQEEATEENIAEIVCLLEEKRDTFAILEINDLTYMQTLWTANGYDLEYQEGSILNHYRVKELLTQEEAIWVLTSYSRGETCWKTKFEFEQKEIATHSYKCGYRIGYFLGRLLRFLKKVFKLIVGN